MGKAAELGHLDHIQLLEVHGASLDRLVDQMVLHTFETIHSAARSLQTFELHFNDPAPKVVWFTLKQLQRAISFRRKEEAATRALAQVPTLV